jgi:hypothetical protein
MTSIVTLSSLDFLKLADNRIVKRVDLSPSGHAGIVFIRELSEGEKAKATGGMRGKARYGKDGSTEIDMSNLPQDAAVKLIKASLVTDETGKVLMASEWEKELKNGSAVIERLNSLPSGVVNLLVKEIRILSGMTEDKEDVTEKKDES